MACIRLSKLDTLILARHRALELHNLKIVQKKGGALMHFNVKIPAGSVLCTGIYAKTAFGQSEQKKDANGVLLWSIRALNGPELFNVTVAADKQPAIAQNELVEFENLEVHISKKADNTKLVWFTCDSVRKAGE